MKKLITALFMTVCVLAASANNNTTIAKAKMETEQKSKKTHSKIIVRVIDVTLSCGIQMSVNFPNSWTTQQIINWVLNADAQLCGGGVGGGA